MEMASVAVGVLGKSDGNRPHVTLSDATMGSGE